MKKIVLGVCFISFFVLLFFAEFKTGFIQSYLLSSYVKDVTYSVKDEQVKDPFYPKEGPLNERYGYTKVGDFVNKLSSSFEISRQAELSEKHKELAKMGINPIYRTKDFVGFQILDANGQLLYDRKQVYFERFDQIPPILVNTLLFIENKELLNNSPYYNPAIELDRLVKASALYVANKVSGSDNRTAGGSTLATQMEKYSFSKDGKTNSGKDKLLQLAGASLRSYQEGPETFTVRKDIILKYFNTMPLGAAVHYGDVYGYGEALRVFYDVDFKTEMELLNAISLNNKLGYSEEQLAALNRAIQLIISVRNPSLLAKPTQLTKLKKGYLKILLDGNIIIHQAQVELEDRFESKKILPLQKKNFVENKSQDLIRKKVSQVLKLDYHSLDKLDLKVDTTIRKDIQGIVSSFFEQLKDPEFLDENNLRVAKLLDYTDPDKVVYSFNLFELENGQAKLRAIYDNIDQPFSFNDSSKLELGSSAKMRVLVTYLDVIAKAYEEKKQGKLLSKDPLSQFVLQSKEENLEALLTLSLDRKYSASPSEAFFTGGGLHKFANYNEEDDDKIVTLREALMRSINLPFVRALKDVVHFYKARNPNYISDKNPEIKKELLNEFIDKESKVFLVRYFKYLKAKKDVDLSNYVAFDLTKGPIGSAAVINYFYEGQTDEQVFERLLANYKKLSPREVKAIKELNKNYRAGIFDINDLGFLAKLHPILLYTAKRMIADSEISLSTLIKESYEIRVQSYEWLFKTKHVGEQYRRIDIILESQAFQVILQQWLELGYPFETIIPSLATALGSSGDKPIALARLIGILSNKGQATEDVLIDRYSFAQGTPYEAVLDKKEKSNSKQVVSVEVAKVARKALQDVVEGGTAIRMKGLMDPLIVGGKTGTGDNRLEIHDSAGNMTESTSVNRTSTFVFYVGDRWFGSITIYVDKDEADHSTFTSSLAVTLMKMLGQDLKPIMLGEY